MGFLGLFEDEIIDSVELSVSPMFDKLPPNYLIGNIVKAILNSGDLTYTVLKSFSTGPTSNLKRFMRYGKNDYYYRLPTLTTTFAYFNIDAVEAVLEGIEGEPIEISSYYYGAMTPNVNGAIQLYKYHGLDLNTMTLEYGTPPYWVETYTYIGVEKTNPTRAILRAIDTDAEAPIGDDGPTIVYKYQYITVAPPPSGLWYVALYSKTSEPDTELYFEYKANTGTYPTLDYEEDTPDTDITPIAILRQLFKYVDENIENDPRKEIYNSTKKLLDKLTIDIQDLLEALKNPKDADGNPTENQMDKVTNVFFNFGTPIDTNDKNSQRYIYHFFDSIKSKFTSSKAEYTSLTALDQTKYKNSYRVKEEFYDYNFIFNYIDDEIKTGVIGPVRDVQIILDIDQSDNAENAYQNLDYGYATGEVDPVRSKVIIKYQISSTQYKQLEIGGLYIIHQIPTVVGSPMAKYVYLKDTANFYIPFIPSILLDELTLIMQESPIYESMLLVAYAADRQVIDWWDAFLGSILGQLIITILVTVVTGYFFTGSLPAMDVLIRKVAINFTLNQVIQKVLGPLLGENIAILALAIGAVTIASGMMFGNATGSLSFSDILLKSVEAVGKAIRINTQVQLENLQDELMELADLTKSVEEQIDDIQDQMEDRMGLIDPYALITKPGDRYWRNTSGFIANSLKTPLDLVQDSKNGQRSFLTNSVDPWTSLPTFI